MSVDSQRMYVLSSIRNASVSTLNKIACVSKHGVYNKKAAIKEIQSALSSGDESTIAKIIEVAVPLLKE